MPKRLLALRVTVEWLCYLDEVDRLGKMWDLKEWNIWFESDNSSLDIQSENSKGDVLLKVVIVVVNLAPSVCMVCYITLKSCYRWGRIVKVRAGILTVL